MKLKPGLRVCFAAAVVALLLIAGAGIVSAQSNFAQGSPDLDVYVPDNEVTPGTEYRSESEETFSIQIDNDGQ